MGSENCEICNCQQHKYKCPKCLLKYCSVACFKGHKAVGCTVKEVSNVQHNGSNGVKPVEEDLEEGELSSDGEGDYESEDRVSNEMLALLGQNKDIVNMLTNPHLQTMLTSLSSAENPSKAIDSAMQEPIFIELVDQCLKTVEPEKTSHLMV